MGSGLIARPVNHESRVPWPAHLSRTMSTEVLIVSGGIGGLTAAVALQKAGCDVQVLERAEEISAIGAGIALQTNAMMALERIGVAEDISAAGVPIRSGRISSWSGSVFRELDFSDAPVLGVGIHRAALQRILSEHAGRENVRTGAALASYRLVGDRVVVVLESGDEVAGELLVGAEAFTQQLGPSISTTARPSILGTPAGAV